MVELAVVVLAHADPTHVRRLVSALAGLPIYLHCDAKTPRADAEQMQVRGCDVTALDRLDTRLASWSLVRAELAGVRAALDTASPRHIAVLSGADYPLVPVNELVRTLDPWSDHSFFYNRPLPFDRWNTRLHHDGGRWRMRYRVLTSGDNAVSWRGRTVRSPLPRRIPDGLELRASSQWKIYSRRDARNLLRVTEENADVVRFWRTTTVPDESFAASVLSTPRLVTGPPLHPCLAHPWLVEFPPGGDHPRVLGTDDWGRLAQARHDPPIDPETALAAATRPRHRKLFARKFASGVSGTVLDRVDEELRR